jgi:hypothetical protein
MSIQVVCPYPDAEIQVRIVYSRHFPSRLSISVKRLFSYLTPQRVRNPVVGRSKIGNDCFRELEANQMKTNTRVVVIGGGVVGCSVLYHLTKLGWSDVMLLERSELTSGSTWHAAGGFHTLNGDTNMAALQGYTIRLYRELEEITGMSCGLHHVGGITLADNQERFDMLLAERAKHRYMGP